jgi:glutamate N-acetyltransferase/amino-acid N-acetyltransferase
LRNAVGRTFNAITVDGDTSTNDSVILLANGASDCAPLGDSGPDFDRFSEALESLCKSLALAIVEDGEGAQRVIEIQVQGARSDREADQVARTIANSSLVKTAFAGADPNWGRILAAAGCSGVDFDPNGVEIRMAGILVYRRGVACKFDERVAHKKLSSRYVPVVVDLGSNSNSGALAGTARIWTCDFTAEYVRINASYRT